MILPLSAPGNAGVAALSMKNAAEMALAEFKEPNIQLLVKDDAGTPQGAQQGAQQAIDEGAEIIIGPLFAQSVSAVGSVARARNIPVIAFSTDASVAARGVYLLSFLPESDVKRIVDYAISQGQALVRGAAAGQCLWRGGGGGVPAGRSRGAAAAWWRWKNIRSIRARWPSRSGAWRRRRARSTAFSFPTAPTRCRKSLQVLSANGVNLKRVQLLGTGLWDDPRIFSTAALDGGWYAAPESTGFRNFSARYRARYGQDPVRTATLAYDAVALVAALVKTQGRAALQRAGADRRSGFAGIDGIFRFRPDGTNERGLAVLRVAPSGGQVVSPAPRSFAPGT